MRNAPRLVAMLPDWFIMKACDCADHALRVFFPGILASTIAPRSVDVARMQENTHAT